MIRFLFERGVTRGMALLLAAVSVVNMPLVHAEGTDGKTAGLAPGNQSVVRPSQPDGQNPTGQQGQCVMDFSKDMRPFAFSDGRPIFRLDCNLEVSDPAAKVVVKGWYRTKDIKNIIDKLRSTPLTKDGAVDAVQLRDALAKELLARPKDSSIAFWHAQPVRPPQPLDPPQGETLEWDSSPFLYRANQLSAAMDEVVAWAEQWMLYRRDALSDGLTPGGGK